MAVTATTSPGLADDVAAAMEELAAAKARLTKAQQRRRLTKLTWRQRARPDQLPPPGDWNKWYIRGGRGSGKTWTAANLFAEWILADPDPGEWGIISPTYPDAWSVAVEGESGFLAALGTNVQQIKNGESDLVEHWHRSFAEIRLRSGHIVRVASAQDGGLRIQGKNLRGAWCIAAGERVMTACGEVPVEQVRPHVDQVWTRGGWRDVTARHLTRRNADTLTLETDNGHSIRLTSDHQVWTEEAGWITASRVRSGMTVLTCPSRDHLPGLNGRESAGTVAPPGKGKARAATTPTAQAACCTSPSGNESTAGGCLTSTSSTMKTMTRPTTTRETWWPSLAKNIYASTAFLDAPTLPRSGKPSARRSRPHGRNGSRAPSSARSAVLDSCPQDSAPGSAPTYAARRSTVLNVAPAGLADVYDLTVSGAHEFFAGGILVHNCDEIGLWDNWEVTWDESLKFAVRKGQSKIIATGTPKKTRKARKLVRRLLDDPDVPCTRLRTIDNADNLSAAFLAEVVGKSKGTRLERQELEGDLLDDVEGALWTPEVIDAARVDPASVPDLTRVVVAVDPAVTSTDESDETGIVVAGETGGGEGYVLADYSMRGTPDACMRKAVWAYRHHKADRVVGEANNGGDYIGSLLRTVDPGIPYSKVTASRGKAIRAEPVSALYEQGRIHHCGAFDVLEAQMCSFVPGKSAEHDDRMDALVWAFTELRGLSAGSWLDGYGATVCGNEKCKRPYLREADGKKRTQCPHCKAPVEQPDEQPDAVQVAVPASS